MSEIDGRMGVASSREREWEGGHELGKQEGGLVLCMRREAGQQEEVVTPVVLLIGSKGCPVQRVLCSLFSLFWFFLVAWWFAFFCSFFFVF